MNVLKLALHDRERSREAKAILEGLIAYNLPYGGYEDWRELTITFKDAKGKVVAGLNGHSDWGWLFVKILWVASDHRSRGLGAKLMRAAEREARKRKCTDIWLDTFSFQAPSFYRKLGFRQFGRLRNYPQGHSRHFMTKSLTAKGKARPRNRT